MPAFVRAARLVMTATAGVAGTARRRRRAVASSAELERLTLKAAYGSSAVHSAFQPQKEASRPRLHPPSGTMPFMPLPDSLMPLGGSSGTVPIMPIIPGAQGAASVAGCRAQLPPPPSLLSNLMGMGGERELSPIGELSQLVPAASERAVVNADALPPSPRQHAQQSPRARKSPHTLASLPHSPRTQPPPASHASPKQPRPPPPQMPLCSGMLAGRVAAARGVAGGGSHGGSHGGSGGGGESHASTHHQHHQPPEISDVDLIRNGGGRGNKDVLLEFGLATLGPIAAGAFSRVVRARQVRAPL